MPFYGIVSYCDPVWVALFTLLAILVLLFCFALYITRLRRCIRCPHHKDKILEFVGVVKTNTGRFLFEKECPTCGFKCFSRIGL